MESDIDESDPLWQAVLKIAEGDRARAEKMLSDPDQLAQYPEVEAILAAGGGGGEDWEKDLADETKEKMVVEEKPKPMEVDKPAAVEEPEEEVSNSLPDLPEIEEREKLTMEKEVLGFYLSSHPLESYRDRLTRFCSHTTSQSGRLENRLVWSTVFE